MAGNDTYSPFDRVNERWPQAGDSIFAPGRDAWPADTVGERNYRLGKGYKLAGDTLVTNIPGAPGDYDNLIYPIFFCYRHYIEITLKEIIAEHGPWVGVSLINKDHKLPELWKLFMQIASVYNNDPSDIAAVAVASCIDEFAQVDPGSFSFRYAQDKRSGELIPLEFGSLDLVNVLDVMNGIENFFECAQLDFGHKRDMACEIAGESGAFD